MNIYIVYTIVSIIPSTFSVNVIGANFFFFSYFISSNLFSIDTLIIITLIIPQDEMHVSQVLLSPLAIPNQLRNSLIDTCAYEGVS